MHLTAFGKQYILFMLAAIAVCTLIALIAQLIGQGKIGWFGKFVVILTAAAGSFLSLHRDDIGKFTKDEWMHKIALASLIVEAFFITLLSLGNANVIYKRFHKK